MKPHNQYFKNKFEICLYGMLLISAILPALLAVKNIIISPDSMMYALVSQEILSGNGIRLPMIYDLRDNHIFIKGTVSFVLDPPLFSILLALMGGVTSHSFLAAKILNVVCHVVISVFSFQIMKELYDNKGIAVLTGMLISFSYPLLWNTHHMISESLFIALTVTALYFLISSRHSFNSTGKLFAAATCTSAAILTKYAGMSLLPLFLWGTFVLVKNKSIKLNPLPALAAALPVVTAGALFIRAYIVSGSIHGWKPPSPERSWFNAVTGTIETIFQMFDLGERGTFLITIFLILLILYIVVNTETRRELAKYLRTGLDLIIIFMISHTLLISYAMIKSQTVFEFRYMSPLAPFIFIIMILTMAVVWELIRRKGFIKLSLSGLLLFLVIITLGNLYKTYVRSEMFHNKQEKQYLILKSNTYQWIKENYGNNVIITSNRPYHLSFFGGYSTIRLPHKRFEIYSWVPDDMKSYLPKRMSEFGSQVLALFEEADEQYEGSYISGLFNDRKDDDNFLLIKQFSDGVIYKIKE